MLVLSQLFSFLSLIASTWAIMVTEPTQGTVWSSKGPNQVSWQSVDTDPTTFAIVLVSIIRSSTARRVVTLLRIQVVNQGHFVRTLVPNVDGTKGTVIISDNDLPAGNGFQINVVKSAQELNTILAQSDDFAISGSGGGSTGSSSSIQGTTSTTLSSTPSSFSSTSRSASTIGSSVMVTVTSPAASGASTAGSDSKYVKLTRSYPNTDPSICQRCHQLSCFH